MKDSQKMGYEVKRRIEMNKKMYYCNVPCVVKSYIENEAVIEIATYYDIYSEHDTGYEEINFEYQTIIVDKKYLSENRIDYKKEQQEILKDATTKAKDIIKKAKSDAQDIIRDQEEKLKTLESRIKKIEGFDTYLDYLEGKIKYIIKPSSYGQKNIFEYYIMTIEEFEGKERKDEDSLRAFILEKSRFREDGIKIILNQYSDYSGSDRLEVLLFKTFEEVKSFIFAKLNENEDISYNCIGNLENYNISHSLIDAKKQIRKESRIAEIEKDIAKLHNSLEEKINKLNSITE